MMEIFSGIRFFVQQSDGKLVGDSGKASGAVASYKQIFSNAAVTDGAWHCGIFVWDGSNLNLYVDNKASTPPILGKRTSLFSNVISKSWVWKQQRNRYPIL